MKSIVSRNDESTKKVSTAHAPKSRSCRYSRECWLTTRIAASPRTPSRKRTLAGAAAGFAGLVILESGSTSCWTSCVSWTGRGISSSTDVLSWWVRQLYPLA